MKMILNGASKFYQPITLTEIEEEKNMEITNEIPHCIIKCNQAKNKNAS